MEMTYDGALVMPIGHVLMEEEEMTYVEGGRWIYTDPIAWGIDLALVATGLNISAIGTLSTRGLSSLAKKVWPKISGKVASYLGQVTASAIGSVIGRLSFATGIIASATSLGGIIALAVDAYDGKLDSKFTW